MSEYRYIAMPQKTADRVRQTMKSPGYGHPAFREAAAGYGPCRLCLKTFEIEKDERILFTFDPFFGLESLPLPGPVFIHAGECKRYEENSGFPDDLRAHALTLNAYARGRRLMSQVYITDGRIENAIAEVFVRPEVDYAHVRDTKAGCYDLRVERRIKGDQ